MTDLPLDLSPFIGRDDLLVAATGQLGRVRLLTLTGSGGAGKTRLALRIAAGLDRVHLADLTALTDGAQLWAHLALTLGIRHHGDPGPAVVAAHLVGPPAVLLLDGCDRLVPETAAAVTALLRAAPRLKILATSRQRLGVDGEHTLTVPPLTVPDAARLFTELATAAGISPAALADRGAVERLCRHLDGLPLAVKLAAGRARTMSLTELTDRTGDRFGLLSPLERVVDLSYRMCTADEQALWQAAAVFAGPFTAAAVRAVAGDRADALDGLVDKSVLTAATDTHPARFSMLATLRDYGLRRLGDQRATRDRHGDHYRAFLARAAGTWFSARELDVLAGVRRELPDILAAVDHSLATGRIGTARGLLCDLVRTRAPFFWGFLDLTLTRLRRATEHPDPDGRAATAALTAWIAATQGRDLPGRTDDGGFAAGACAVLLHADPAALPVLDAARDPHTGDGHMATMMWAIGTAFTDGSATAAAQHLHEAERAGAPWAISWALWTGALAAHRGGAPARAAALIERCLQMQRSMDDQWGQTWSIELAAWIIAARPGADDARRAAWLLGAATARQQRLGVDLAGLGPFAAGRATAHRQISAVLGPAVTTEQITAGRHGHGHAVRIALGEPASRRASAPAGGLTAREREIAALVADGLTSPQIAARLRISARTADTHIRNIGTKLGLPNRAAIAAWAVR